VTRCEKHLLTCRSRYLDAFAFLRSLLPDNHYPDVYLARRLVQWIGGMEATGHEEEPAVANQMDWSMQKPS
jgi:hypothetical protein